MRESQDGQLGTLGSRDVISVAIANYAVSTAAAAADGDDNENEGEEEEEEENKGGGGRGRGNEICLECLLWLRAGIEVYADFLISTFERI